MAKITRLSQDGEAEGTVIEMQGLTLTVRAMDADTVLALAQQLNTWSTTCYDLASRLQDYTRYMDEIQRMAIDANWLDKFDGELLVKLFDELRGKWEQAVTENEVKREAYDDCWAEIASRLDQQASKRLDRDVDMSP